jgi:hypothetical protein
MPLWRPISAAAAACSRSLPCRLLRHRQRLEMPYLLLLWQRRVVRRQKKALLTSADASEENDCGSPPLFFDVRLQGRLAWRFLFPQGRKGTRGSLANLANFGERFLDTDDPNHKRTHPIAPALSAEHFDSAQQPPGSQRVDPDGLERYGPTGPETAMEIDSAHTGYPSPNLTIYRDGQVTTDPGRL